MGDTNTGKTCLMLRFAEGRFDDNSMATIGVDVSTATLDLGAASVGLQLWDTAGQARRSPHSARRSRYVSRLPTCHEPFPPLPPPRGE